MPIAVSWEKARRNHYKLNMDGTLLGNLEVGGMGGILAIATEIGFLDS